jgi:hypothetical protein
MIDLLVVVLQASALVLAIAVVWALMVVLGFGLVQHLREQRGASSWTHASKGRVKPDATPGPGEVDGPPLTSPALRDSPLLVRGVGRVRFDAPVEFAAPGFDEKVRLLRERLGTVAPRSTEWQQIRAELAALGEEV